MPDLVHDKSARFMPSKRIFENQQLAILGMSQSWIDATRMCRTPCLVATLFWPFLACSPTVTRPVATSIQGKDLMAKEVQSAINSKSAHEVTQERINAHQCTT
jgi:hypothetical protein